MDVLLFSLYTNHDDRPMFEKYVVRFLPRPSQYNCITVDMLVNIVGHKIDGNYESWKYMGQKRRGDRLAPGRGPSSPHPGASRFFGWCLK